MVRTVLLGLLVGATCAVGAWAQTSTPTDDLFEGVEIWACHDQARNDTGLIGVRRLNGQAESIGELAGAGVSQRYDTIRISTEFIVVEIDRIDGDGGILIDGRASSIRCKSVTGQFESIIQHLMRGESGNE